MTTIHVGDCREVMAEMEPESIDAIVTDPPYELNFMSKGWDRTGVAFTPDTWREAYRVLKPGGHLLAFGGTRTVHRLACAIEDAGFEIRDQVVWLYGSGFPKSLDVSKAIDKVNGETDRLPKFTSWMRTTGLTAQQINDATGTFMGSHYLTSKSQPAIPTPELWTILRPLCGDVPAWVDQLVERIAAEREVVGEQSRQGKPPQFMWGDEDGQSWDITAPATPDAERWQGWGTALKPAHEPVVVARKPLIGTVAANVLTHGTGALNVDGCRIETNPDDALAMERANTPGSGRFNAIRSEPGAMGRSKAGQPMDTTSGRWPANVVLDEEAAAMLDAQSGTEVSRFFLNVAPDLPIDSGDELRFRYCAKAPQSERWGILSCNCQTDKLNAWENEDQNHNDRTDTTSPPRDIYGALSTAGCDLPTLSSGNGDTGKFPTDSKFIIETATNSTIESKISNSSRQPNTNGFTAVVPEPMTVNGSNPAESADSTNRLPSNTGTSVTRVGRSMVDVGPVTSLRSSSTNVCERCGNPKQITSHPTQKPVALMRWLIRLVTPPGGIVLDPFLGSGTTGIAAALEGVRFVGIEQSPEYAQIARRRIEHAAIAPAEFIAASDEPETTEAGGRNVYGNGNGNGTGYIVPRCAEHGASIPSGSNTYGCGCAKVILPPSQRPVRTQHGELQIALPLFAAVAD
jgi:DNA modification methylase